MPDGNENLKNPLESTSDGDYLDMTRRDISESEAPDAFMSYGARQASDMESSGRLTNSDAYIDPSEDYGPYNSAEEWAEWRSPYADTTPVESTARDTHERTEEDAPTAAQGSITIPRVQGSIITPRVHSEARQRAEAATQVYTDPNESREAAERAHRIARVVAGNRQKTMPVRPTRTTRRTQELPDAETTDRQKTMPVRPTRTTRQAQESPDAETTERKTSKQVNAHTHIEQRREFMESMFNRETTGEDFSYYKGYRTRADSTEGERERREESQQKRKAEFQTGWRARNTSYAVRPQSVESRRQEFEQAAEQSIRFAVPLLRGAPTQDGTQPHQQHPIYSSVSVHEAQAKARNERVSRYRYASAEQQPSSTVPTPEGVSSNDPTVDQTVSVTAPRVTVTSPAQGPVRPESRSQTSKTMKLSGTADLTVNGVPMGELQLNLEGVGG